jgi:hypothetical protein
MGPLHPLFEKQKTAMSILLGQPANPANASFWMRQKLHIQNEGLQCLQALVDELHGGQNFCQDGAFGATRGNALPLRGVHA